MGKSGGDDQQCVIGGDQDLGRDAGDQPLPELTLCRKRPLDVMGDTLELCAREAGLLLSDGFAELDRRVTGERRAAVRPARDRRRTPERSHRVLPTHAG